MGRELNLGPLRCSGLATAHDISTADYLIWNLRITN